LIIIILPQFEEEFADGFLLFKDFYKTWKRPHPTKQGTPDSHHDIFFFSFILTFITIIRSFHCWFGTTLLGRLDITFYTQFQKTKIRNKI